MEIRRLYILQRHLLVLQSQVINFEKDYLQEKIEESVKQKIITDIKFFKGLLSILIFSSKIKSKKNFKTN